MEQNKLLHFIGVRLQNIFDSAGIKAVAGIRKWPKLSINDCKGACAGNGMLPLRLWLILFITYKC